MEGARQIGQDSRESSERKAQAFANKKNAKTNERDKKEERKIQFENGKGFSAIAMRLLSIQYACAVPRKPEGYIDLFEAVAEGVKFINDNKK